MATKFKYSEDKIIEEVFSYVKGTYGEHYVMDDEMQAIDVWGSMGSGASTSRDLIIKYLLRFGKKDGKNRKDIMKCFHYLMFMYYFEFVKPTLKNKVETGTEQ